MDAGTDGLLPAWSAQEIAKEIVMGDGRDDRDGAYDPIDATERPVSPAKVRQKETPHQRAQWGADVRGEPELPAFDEPMPEGLRRARKEPYDRNRGRRGE
jgi:hypothetical protein